MVIIGYLLIIIGAISKAIMDKVNFHFDESLFNNPKFNRKFWDKELSWENKWLEYKTNNLFRKFIKKFILTPLDFLLEKFIIVFNFFIAIFELPWVIDRRLTIRATILVFTTDAWHLFQSLMLFSIFSGTLLIFSDSTLLGNIFHFFIINILFRVVFTFFFHTILKK